MILRALLLMTLFATPLTAAPRRAFVACEADDRLPIVNLDTLTVERTLPTGKTPHAIVFTPTGKGYVNNRGAPTLTVVDAHTDAVVKTIALPAASFQLALSPDGRTLAIAHKDALALTLLDTATDRLLFTVTLGTVPAGASGALTRHPLWTGDGRSVWVPDCANNRLVRVDLARGTIAATIPTPAAVHYLHALPGGVLCAVTEGAGAASSLAFLAPDATALSATLSVPLEAGEKPSLHHGALSGDGARFFACRDGGRSIAVIDVATRSLAATIPTRPGPGHAALSADGKRLFVTHHRDDAVSVVDVARQAVTQTIAIGPGTKQSHSAWLAPDRFFVCNAEGGTLVAIDTATLAVVGKVPVGNTPMFFAVQDGDHFPATE